LSAKLNLQKISSNFIEILTTDFVKVKITKNILKWYKLEFNEFIEELKKNKINLTLRQKADWLEFFKEEKLKAINQSEAIFNIESQIDQLVYNLYGLTQEEILLIEEKV
jgi:hypothetical protein